MDENEIRSRIRERLKEGILPTRGVLFSPGPRQGGEGFIGGSCLVQFHKCAACDDFGPDHSFKSSDKELCFHHKCCQIWLEELKTAT
jgi:hypothetical protein